MNYDKNIEINMTFKDRIKDELQSSYLIGLYRKCGNEVSIR